MLENTTLLSQDVCPACGYKLDAATGLDDQSPEPNDLTVCLNCAFILVFDKHLKVRKATNADLATLDTTTRDKLALVLNAVTRYIRSKN